MNAHGCRRPVGRVALLTAWALLVLAGASARAELVDRVLAKVGDRVITLSDVRMVQRLGLIDPA